MKCAYKTGGASFFDDGSLLDYFDGMCFNFWGVLNYEL